MRVLLTAVTYLVSVAVLAPVLLVVTIVLAGPHSSILPSRLQPVVVIIEWVTLVVAPVVLARAVWRRRAPQPD